MNVSISIDAYRQRASVVALAGDYISAGMLLQAAEVMQQQGAELEKSRKNDNNAPANGAIKGDK